MRRIVLGRTHFGPARRDRATCRAAGLARCSAKIRRTTSAVSSSVARPAAGSGYSVCSVTVMSTIAVRSAVIVTSVTWPYSWVPVAVRLRTRMA